jgi:beta-galactosidase
MLVEYAAKGGHLVIGIRTGYADSEARARLAVAPDILAGPAGIWYEEFSNLDAALPVAATNEDLTLSPGASATRWIEGLIPDGAASLVEYVHPQHGRFPAVTTNAHGEGRISYVGTVPNRVLGADLMRAFIPKRVADAWSIPLGSPVTVTSGRVGDTRRAWFVHNWSGVPQSVAVPSAFLSLADSTEVPAGPTDLAPWSVLAVIDV